MHDGPGSELGPSVPGPDTASPSRTERQFQTQRTMAGAGPETGLPRQRGSEQEPDVASPSWIIEREPTGAVTWPMLDGPGLEPGS
jgi:hypothetical protein